SHFRLLAVYTPHSITLILRSFFFNATATTEIYTLSLHDALPIFAFLLLLSLLLPSLLIMFIPSTFKRPVSSWKALNVDRMNIIRDRKSGSAGMPRPISYAVFCLKKKKKYDTQLCDTDNRNLTQQH